MIKKKLVKSLCILSSVVLAIFELSGIAYAVEQSISDDSTVELLSNNSGIFNAGATQDSKFTVADGVTIGDTTTVISSSTTDGVGNLVFLGSATADGDIASLANRIHNISLSNLRGSFVTINGDVFSENMEIQNSRLLVNGNMDIDNIIFKRDGLLEVSDNYNITADISTYGSEANQGTLRFTGASSSSSLITGNIGTSFNKLKLLDVGDTDLAITGSIYSDNTNINTGALNINNNIYSNIEFLGDGLIIVEDNANILGNISSISPSIGNLEIKGQSTLSGSIGSLSNPLNEIQLGTISPTSLELKQDIFADSIVLNNDSQIAFKPDANIFGTITTDAPGNGALSILLGGSHIIDGQIATSITPLDSITIDQNSTVTFKKDVFANNLVASNSSNIIVDKEAHLNVGNDLNFTGGSLSVSLSGDPTTEPPIVTSTNTMNLDGTEIIVNGTTINNVTSTPVNYQLVSSTSAITGTPIITYNGTYAFSFQDVVAANNEIVVSIAKENDFVDASLTMSSLGSTIDSYIANPSSITDETLSSEFDYIIANSSNEKVARSNLQRMAPIVDNYIIDNGKLLNRLVNENIENHITEIHIKKDGFKNLNIWGQNFYSKMDQDFRDDIPGYEADIYGFVLGIEKEFAENNNLGISIAYANSDSDSDLLEVSGFETDSYIISLYSKNHLKQYNMYIDSMLNVGLHDHNSDRYTPDGKGAFGSWDAISYNAKVKVSYDQLLKGNVYVKPNISLSVGFLEHDEYSETNAQGSNLYVDNDNNKFLSSSVGVDLLYRIKASHADLTPHIGISALFDLSKDNFDTKFSLDGDKSKIYNIHSPDPEQLSINIDAGLSIYSKDNIDLQAKCIALFREDYNDYSAIAKLIYNF